MANYCEYGQEGFKYNENRRKPWLDERQSAYQESIFISWT
jgi:hypothetical protein